MVARARTAAVAHSKPATRGLSEIDREVTTAFTKRHDAEERGVLKTVLGGGGFAKVELHKFGAADDTRCDYCQAEMCDIDHLLWECPRFQQLRSDAAPDLAQLDFTMLSRTVRRGVAPAMACQHDRTFWGHDLNRIRHTDDATKAMLGYDLSIGSELSDYLAEAGKKGLNARQMVAHFKGVFGEGTMPEFPIEVAGTPPELPNGYCDGGYKNPTYHRWAVWGVWHMVARASQ